MRGLQADGRLTVEPLCDRCGRVPAAPRTETESLDAPRLCSECRAEFRERETAPTRIPPESRTDGRKRFDE